MSKNSHGIAIILVIFIVALASILVINLTYSTFLSTRAVGMVERQLQAEYILKSLINFSSVLIQNDTNQSDSFSQDVWGFFNSNTTVPNHYLGIQDSSAEISLRISPVNSKFNISFLATQGQLQGPSNNLQALENLMTNLNFEEAQFIEEDHTGLFQGRTFSIKELIGNLIDWQDGDNESFDNNGDYNGIEGSLREEQVYNKRFTKLGQLQMVPGMTPRRYNAIAPYLHTVDNQSTININTAEDQVLYANFPNLTPVGLEEFKARIFAQPLTSRSEDLTIYGMGVKLVNYDIRSASFEIIAKVKYGLQRAYFAKAILKRGNSSNPTRITSAVYY